MTKEKIFDDQFYFLRDFLMYKSTPVRLKDIVLDCMQKYADCEIISLLAEVNRLKDENSMLLERINNGN